MAGAASVPPHSQRHCTDDEVMMPCVTTGFGVLTIDTSKVQSPANTSRTQCQVEHTCRKPRSAQ